MVHLYSAAHDAGSKEQNRETERKRGRKDLCYSIIACSFAIIQSAPLHDGKHSLQNMIDTSFWCHTIVEIPSNPGFNIVLCRLAALRSGVNPETPGFGLYFAPIGNLGLSRRGCKTNCLCRSLWHEGWSPPSYTVRTHEEWTLTSVVYRLQKKIIQTKWLTFILLQNMK